MSGAGELPKTYGDVAAAVGNSLSLHRWDYPNGATITARRKVTKRGGVVVTSWIHIWRALPGGLVEMYRETAPGEFKLMGTARGAVRPHGGEYAP